MLIHCHFHFMYSDSCCTFHFSFSIHLCGGSFVFSGTRGGYGDGSFVADVGNQWRWTHGMRDDDNGIEGNIATPSTTQPEPSSRISVTCSVTSAVNFSYSSPPCDFQFFLVGVSAKMMNPR